MLLRASGEREHRDYNLGAVNSDDQSPGVEQENWLRALTEQTVRGEWQMLRDTRRSAENAMGSQQVVDALTVAAAFNGITRVADATGIPLDDNTLAVTAEMRRDVGLNAFDYSQKSQRYG